MVRILVSLILFPLISQAAIYGVDDRVEANQSVVAKRFSSAMAMMISPVYMKQAADQTWSVDYPVSSSDDGYGICPSERFAVQPASTLTCTGFLIAPNLLVTAGHCMVNVGEAVDVQNPQCRDFHWLFDFMTDVNGRVQTTGIAPERVVRCKRVVYAVHEGRYDPKTQITHPGKDFAIVELETAQPHRAVLPLANSFVKPREAISSFGYPLGLALKSMGTASVVEQTHPEYARTTLDTLSGNSGSPVLNTKNEVVGIVVRAFPDDFVDVPGMACSKLNRCTQDLRSCTEADPRFPIGSQIQSILSVRDRL
ncbi:MAG TPA: serine protease [Bdellovibrionales bacterium]|jgi:hypothetical protein|nr:serine protease [Bdellovibrionales bacterium]